jgi:tRNA (mo5U34)-methyltransferase
MLDFDALCGDLEANGLESWCGALKPLLDKKLSDAAHGDLPKWRQVLASLPSCDSRTAELTGPVIVAGPDAFPPSERERVRQLLMQLAPWRKGPFQVGDILIDAEWRSDRKWARLEDAISPLADRRVLDVGCGNGYYALRMRGKGARLVVGADPMLLYLAQHAAIRHFMPRQPVHVLPLRLRELPDTGSFDTVFSMGVLYHQRAPQEHLDGLRRALRPGGELVLETLILPGSRKEARTPGRYARMKNVWLLPTLPLLLEWVEQAGFTEVQTVDISTTTKLEQRRTDWMTFESLAESLDPGDPGLTVEGWPAPQRAVVVSRCQGPTLTTPLF